MQKKHDKANGQKRVIRPSPVQWPEGKQFAFTIFDDTDYATIANVAPVYRLLENLGFRTTKSVWPLRGDYIPKIGGSTCAEDDYREWIFQLLRQGFEIGYHGATLHSSTRENSRAGLEKFKEYFGHSPTVYANHSTNAEDIYWGPHRFTGINKILYHILTKGGRYNKYDGHLENSPYFWGDLCKQHVKYVRDFVFTEINTLKECPIMPYHDPMRPYVNYWFASSEGANVSIFNSTFSEKNQDALEEEGGACIMYTHFACGFYEDGNVDTRFRQLLERLGKKKGWFVPVYALLDHLMSMNGDLTISQNERRRMERKFLLDRAKLNLSKKHHLNGFDHMNV
jgi:hypothetical protein